METGSSTAPPATLQHCETPMHPPTHQRVRHPDPSLCLSSPKRGHWLQGGGGEDHPPPLGGDGKDRPWACWSERGLRARVERAAVLLRG